MAEQKTFGQELYHIQREKPWMGINGVIKELGKIFPFEVIDVFVQNIVSAKQIRPIKVST